MGAYLEPTFDKPDQQSSTANRDHLPPERAAVIVILEVNVARHSHSTRAWIEESCSHDGETQKSVCSWSLLMPYGRV